MKDNNTAYGWRFILAITSAFMGAVWTYKINSIIGAISTYYAGESVLKSLLVIDLLSFVECKFGVARTIYFSFQSAQHYYFYNTFHIHQLKYAFLFWWMSTLFMSSPASYVRTFMRTVLNADGTQYSRAEQVTKKWDDFNFFCNC